MIQELLGHKNILSELYDRWLKKDDNNNVELEEYVSDEVENMAAK